MIPAGGPIFIGGIDQSGKTQLRRMLGRHPHLAMTRRSYLWTRFYNRFGDLNEPANLQSCLSAMLKQKQILELHPDPDRIQREFAQGPATYERLFALLHQHNAERLGKIRWGDQLGWVERYADIIFAAYPGVRMIHMIRDPRDRYLVSTAGNGRRGWKFGSSVARWLYSARLAENNQMKYPTGYKILRYEELMSDPESTLKEICSFIEEPFDPSLLIQAEYVADDEDSEDSTPDPGEISAGEALFARLLAGREMGKLGYWTNPRKLNAFQAASFLFVNLPLNLAGMVHWQITEGNTTYG